MQRSKSRSQSPLKSQVVQIEMPKLDLLVVGSSGAGKTALVRTFAANEDHHAGGEVESLCTQVGMSVRSQLYSLGVDTLQHTVRLNLWHPAMRELTEKQIKHYVEKENPVDCAGSFKIEGLGIALMEKMAGNDYTTLIGLPLILLVNMLNHFKVEVL